MRNEVLFPKGYKMTITPQTWIPVSERLPEEQDAYLIVCDEHCDGRCIVVSSGQYEGGGCWTPDYNHMLPSDVVTHWMPLPKPPAT